MNIENNRKNFSGAMGAGEGRDEEGMAARSRHRASLRPEGGGSKNFVFFEQYLRIWREKFLMIGKWIKCRG